ncbi:hypothetical protein AMK59_5656, partial [Oryctes borbonicus]
MQDRELEETVSSLTIGCNELFVLPLLKIEKQISELTKKQQMLIEQLHNENLKLAWSQNSAELQEIYVTIKLYNIKLTTLKRNMKLLHEKTIKLKKRTSRLLQLQKTH